MKIENAVFERGTECSQPAFSQAMVMSIRSLGEKRVRVRRRIHRQNHAAWDDLSHSGGGMYAHYLERIALKFPQLTPMELRVCSLVKAMLPSWRIAELLCITEKAVENYRVKIRKKIGCCGERLTSVLTKI